EYHLFSETIDGHREHQTDEGTQANFVRRWNHQVKRHRALVVHEVIDREIARRSVFRYEWIAVERERGFRSREDAAEVAVLLVEHFLHLLANDGMGECPIASRHAPIVSMSRIVLEVQQFIERLAKAGAGPREHLR